MAKKKPGVNEIAIITDRQAGHDVLKAKYDDLGLGEDPDNLAPVDPKDILPTPSVALNIITGEGGLRPGTILELYGPEGAGKTRTALQICREAQIKFPDKSVAFFDIEQSVDKFEAKHCFGIDMGTFADGTPKFDYFPKDDDPFPTLEFVMQRLQDFITS